MGRPRTCRRSQICAQNTKGDGPVFTDVQTKKKTPQKKKIQSARLRGQRIAGPSEAPVRNTKTLVTIVVDAERARQTEWKAPPNYQNKENVDLRQRTMRTRARQVCCGHGAWDSLWAWILDKDFRVQLSAGSSSRLGAVRVGSRGDSFRRVLLYRSACCGRDFDPPACVEMESRRPRRCARWEEEFGPLVVGWGKNGARYIIERVATCERHAFAWDVFGPRGASAWEKSRHRYC